MLELIALVCGLALIVWQPIEARKVAGGWVRKRHKGTPEEFRANYRRQLTLFMWLGVGIGVANLGIAGVMENDPTRQTVRLVTAAIWFGVAVSAVVARRILDAAPR
jgi:hypothetical protein